jgi:hypothetical protein
MAVHYILMDKCCQFLLEECWPLLSGMHAFTSNRKWTEDLKKKNMELQLQQDRLTIIINYFPIRKFRVNKKQ